MKGFAEDNSTVSTMMINILQGVENIAEKEKMLVTNIYPLLKMFSKVFFSRVAMAMKTRDCWSRVDSLPKDNFLDWSKWKVFADDKIIETLTEILIAMGRKQYLKRLLSQCCYKSVGIVW